MSQADSSLSTNVLPFRRPTTAAKALPGQPSAEPSIVMANGFLLSALIATSPQKRRREAMHRLEGIAHLISDEGEKASLKRAIEIMKGMC